MCNFSYAIMFYSVESSVLFREINIVSALADVCCFKTDARTGVKAILMFALQLFLDAYASQGLAMSVTQSVRCI